jgi:hypothetical protein
MWGISSPTESSQSVPDVETCGAANWKTSAGEVRPMSVQTEYRETSVYRIRLLRPVLLKLKRHRPHAS